MPAAMLHPDRGLIAASGYDPEKTSETWFECAWCHHAFPSYWFTADGDDDEITNIGMHSNMIEDISCCRFFFGELPHWMIGASERPS
jgi:hypothetical protein